MKYWMAIIAAISMAINYYTGNQNGIIVFGFLMIGVLLMWDEK